MTWYADTNWTKRIPLVVDHTKVGSGGVSNFQVRAKLSAHADIGSKSNYDGRDLLVTGSDGTTKLAHELIEYRPYLNSDGCWTWFNDPRAVYYNGRTYVGCVSYAGVVRIDSYDHSTNAWTTGTPLATGFEVDDHNNPAIMIRQDGKILACWSQHVGNSYSAVSQNAEDVTGTWTVQGPVGTLQAYAELIRLPAESNKIYWFYRNSATFRGFRTSVDEGATWVTGATSYLANGSERPYMKCCRNGTDRIDFAFTTGHPGEVTSCSLYHVYYKSGNWYKSDGTLIRSMAAVAAGAPITPSDGTLIYDGTTLLAWVWDIVIDGSGNPVVAYNNYAGGTFLDPRYRYAKWTGSAWIDNEVVSVGDIWRVTGESYYVPGICLDRTDPNSVYCILLGGNNAAWKYTTADGGTTWSGTQVSRSHHSRRAGRPYSIDGGNADMRLLYWEGDYSAYTTFPNTRLASLGAKGNKWADVLLAFKAPSLSSVADTSFYLYYGNTAASAQQDAANTWNATDLFVMHGLDAAWERLGWTVPAGSSLIAKRPSATLLAGETDGLNGRAQLFQGSTLPSIGTVMALAGKTSLYVSGIFNVNAAISGNAAFISNWTTSSTASFLFRTNSTDRQVEMLFRLSSGQVGGKFPDLVMTYGTAAHVAIAYSQAGALIEGFLNGVKSTTTFAAAAAMHATATSVTALATSPHQAQAFRGVMESVRVSGTRPSDAFILTEANNLTSVGTFITAGSVETYAAASSSSGLSPAVPTLSGLRIGL